MSSTNSLTPAQAPASQQELLRKITSIHPECPFDEMAMALSGGGFRAAAFSLGAISYLNRAWYTDDRDLLIKHVTFMTSTSGGTLTNAFYSAQLTKSDFDFDTFFNDMCAFMKDETLTDKVFALLDDDNAWKGSVKSQNLINAFAKAYDELLFKGDLFEVYFQDSNTHLKGVCFNATELNNGVSFRFQTNGDPASIYTVGNYYLHFNNAGIARKLKLGDIAASSSCFPGGFEPICYPNDFSHAGLTDIKSMTNAINYGNNNPLKLASVKDQPFYLVDGGVDDNQGLYSLMMEDNFRAEHASKKPFDLMMVCDVSSYFTDAYVAPDAATGSWINRTVAGIKKLLPLGIGLFILSLLAVCIGCEWIRRLGLFFLLTSLLYTGVYAYLTIILKDAAKTFAKSSWGGVAVRYLPRFAKTKFGTLAQMLNARFNSLSMIAGDLFLNQERRQGYDVFYNMPAYQHRTLSCLIYEFSLQHAQERLDNLKEKDAAWWPAQSGTLAPSAQMLTIATNATGMSTTLWFDPKTDAGKCDDIIACGQFTMCYNLLKHIYRLEVLDDKWKTDATLQKLKEGLIEDWDRFNADAYMMMENRATTKPIPKFQSKS